MNTTPKIVVDIRPMTVSDVALLEASFPESGSAKHLERFLRQQKGEVVYLIAMRQGMPAGHALLKWRGPEDKHVAHKLRFACPDIEDLFVLEELRSQGIGTQILHFIERLVAEHGYAHIGLSVGVATNERARLLYERLGYKDGDFGAYLEHGEYVDAHGQHHTWEENCLYLIKDLESKSIL